MKRFLFIIVMSNLINACKTNVTENGLSSNLGFLESLDTAIFIGTEEFFWIDSLGNRISLNPETPSGKAYFLREFKVIKDSVFMTQAVIEISGFDTLYSNTEGGGVTKYKGVIDKSDSSITFKLTQTSCTFCPEVYQIQNDGSKTRISKTLELTVEESKSELMINNQIYIKTDRDYFN